MADVGEAVGMASTHCGLLRRGVCLRYRGDMFAHLSQTRPRYEDKPRDGHSRQEECTQAGCQMLKGSQVLPPFARMCATRNFGRCVCC